MPTPHDSGLYEAIKLAMQQAPQPQSCYDIANSPPVVKLDQPVSRVSDYLGNLWRKGKLTRVPAMGSDSRARFLYQWRETSPDVVDNGTHVLAKRPALTITENADAIVLDFANLTITIQQKTAPPPTAP